LNFTSHQPFHFLFFDPIRNCHPLLIFDISYIHRIAYKPIVIDIISQFVTIYNALRFCLKFFIEEPFFASGSSVFHPSFVSTKRKWSKSGIDIYQWLEADFFLCRISTTLRHPVA